MRRRCAASLLAAAIAAGPAGAARAADDADVWALIDALRPVAEAIVVDGDASDWGAIPAFADPAGDAGGDPTRDVTSVHIAPTDDALHVLIETAGTPSTGGFAFWLLFDFTGLAFADVELALDAGAPDGLSYFEEGGCSNPSPPFCSLEWDESELAIGPLAVEVRVPYAALDAVLPAAMQGRLSGAGARSWVRVWVHAIDYLPSYTEVDHGSAVASFRLAPTPYALDPPLPAGGDAYTALPSPLPGLWYVGQGPMTNGSHAGVWAYDLHATDNALHPESPVESPNLSDNYGFGQPIVAPAAGTVFSVVDGNPDHPPYDYSPPPPPNFLFLEIAGNLGLLFSHTKQGSIAVGPSDALAAGDALGAVGHSGATGWPHLHYEAQEIDEGFASHPLGLAPAEVGLNPTPADPWRRSLPSWGIREGFFVLPEAGGAAGAAAGGAALALLARRRRAAGR